MRKLAWLCCVVGAAVPVAAAADPIKTAPLIKATCAAPTRADETVRGRLARVILAQQGLFPASEGEAISILAHIAQGGSGTGAVQLRDQIFQLQEEMGSRSNFAPEKLGLRATPAGPGRNSAWLFSDQGVTLECVAVRAPREAPMLPAELRLRQTPEALLLTGKDRLSAGSATLGWKRDQTIQADGSRKTTSTTSFKGALGFVTGSDEQGATLFAGYELQRARTNPAPALAPGVRQRDADTDILQIGASGYFLASGEKASVFFTGDAAVLFDGVKESRRGRLQLTATPAFGRGNLGLCNLGHFTDPIDIGFKFRGRCTLTALGQVNHLFRRGRAAAGPKDAFVLAGGKFAFDVAPPEANGVVAGLSYQYQQVISGKVPSIDQFKGYIKYRYWLGSAIGFDVGLDYTRGINPDSFANDNRFQLGFGVLF